MRDLARLAISAFGRRGEGSGVVGVDVQRIRRSLELQPTAARQQQEGESPPIDRTASTASSATSAASSSAR